MIELSWFLAHVYYISYVPDTELKDIVSLLIVIEVKYYKDN